MIRHVS